MNEMQSQKYQNKEISKKHYQDEENRSINTNENQLIEFSQEHQEKFTQVKNSCIAPNSSENLGNWSRTTTLMLGDSMLPDIAERRISKRDCSKLNTLLEEHLMTCTIISIYQFI